MSVFSLLMSSPEKDGLLGLQNLLQVSVYGEKFFGREELPKRLPFEILGILFQPGSGAGVHHPDGEISFQN